MEKEIRLSTNANDSNIKGIAYILRKWKKEKKPIADRLRLLETFNFKPQLGYIPNATRIGQSEYFPKLKETRIIVARPSKHYYKQFYFIAIKDKI